MISLIAPRFSKKVVELSVQYSALVLEKYF